MTFIRVLLTGTLLLALGFDLRADPSQPDDANRPLERATRLSSAASKAPGLPRESFTRETIRESNKQVIQSVIDNETRSAAAAGMR